MSPETLLEALQARGVELEAVDGNLRYRAPRGALCPELRSELTTHKATLLGLLGRERPTGASGGGHCLKCKAPTDNIRTILCDGCNARRLGVATPRSCPDCGTAVRPHAYRCDACVARRRPPVPWCAAIDCRRPQSGRDEGFCSPQHRQRTEQAWPW